MISLTKRYTDNNVETSLVHGQRKQILACWFRNYCTRIGGPRLWRNTLLSVYLLAKWSIWTNYSNKSKINHWKYWRCCVKYANTITKITITCTSRRNTKIGGFQRHEATYYINNCYWISNDYKVFEGWVNNASCCNCSKRRWFEEKFFSWTRYFGINICFRSTHLQ